MVIVAISDVHCKFQHLKIPKCNILISCGDYSFRGTWEEVKNFHTWLNNQPAEHKISLQGNHELGVESDFALSKQIAEEACPGVHFIDEGLIEIEGLKIWCSAVTPAFNDWAWNRERGEDIKKHWDRIPNDIDILVTHGPPKGILDKVINPRTGMIDQTDLGCEDLLNKVMELPNLKHHFFGHIHSSNGHRKIDNKNFWNCSICDELYRPVQKRFVIRMPKIKS